MIHVINKYNQHLYGGILEDMFRLRHKVFVEGRGWHRLAKEDGLERDEFDNDDTTYFLKLSPDFRILGGMRMYPTSVPTQLNTIFKDTCTLAAPPCAQDHYEWSRYFIVEPEYRSATGKPVHYELYTGILEYAVATGIESLSGFIETATFVRSGRMPWDMRQLGIPYEYGGSHGEPTGYGLPIQLDVNRTMLRKTKLAWRMVKPVLSLSLGEHSPYREVGFKPEVVLQMADFIKQHAEYVGIVAAFAEMLHDVDPDRRDATKDIIAGMEAKKAPPRPVPAMLGQRETAVPSPTIQ